ncbi:MAG: hypothetical protein CME64_15295 [Halobacteriovoraceae bacterium]|nr:hypothetical protein [Halobacteriovoraceae bacterium]|tara:strand:+ start:101841 stop:103487 length:1647 start_codon:yes stop_codon:yes gene_type:complete
MTKFLMIALFCVANVFADSLEINIDPREPLVNENFRVQFEIKTQQGTDPVISFDPLNVDVISRQETGIKTRTTYINGQLSTERSVTVEYEMVAKRAGSAFLRDINVEIGGQKLKHRTLRINVLRTPKKARNILVKAEVSKEEAFVGESIIVRYYLYNKVPVSSTDIKKFPKLDKFLKRYHQEKMTAQRATVDGEIYTRRVIYTAQLYGTEPGTYKVDPITLGVQYSTRGNNPFNTFGFGSRLGGLRKMTMSSKPVVIKIKALPKNNVPSSFTGLVGEHQFNLELSKNKFVVNEPIELKLRVSGPGALELFEAPKIFTSSVIEEFEKNGDLKVAADFSATKTVLYTYLGREPVTIENKTIPFTYFDPESLSFKTKNVDLGKVLVAGGISNRPLSVTGEQDRNQNSGSSQSGNVTESTEVLEPVFRLSNTYTYNAVKIAFALAIIIIVSLMWNFRDSIMSLTRSKNDPLSVLIKEGADYSRLHQVVHALGHGPDMETIINNSSLMNSSKKELIEVAKKCEKEFQANGKAKSFKISKKTARDLVRTGNIKE